MPQFVRQCRKPLQIVGVAHKNERVCALRARGKSAHALALIRVNIHPTLLQTPFFESGDIFLPQRPHPLRNPLHRLFIGHMRFIIGQRRF